MRLTLLIFISIGCTSKVQYSNTNKPRIFAPGVLSTSDHHESVNAITQEGTIYFTRASKDFSNSTLLVSQVHNGALSTPSILTFSGEYYDAGLSFLTNHNWAFFTSKRPTGDVAINDDWNIWRISFENQFQFNSIPELVENPINTPYSECCFITNGKNRAYFSSNREGTWDIYSIDLIELNWVNLVKLTINSENAEWPAFINATDDLLLFSSIRKSGYGGDDIYFTRYLEGNWNTPVILDSLINSKNYEDSPYIGPNGYFYYSSADSSYFSVGVSNIYRVKSPLNIQTHGINFSPN